ncbi:unnamed protein product [Paramecium primaurelia]|uniref:Macro domain-containing protein n=1 Tax=Paramecium primaurelia TaxID=5886 RepID=A0A8S1Q288_PARPR|nr:unnamed protein product [Paramecium primaurelia]
MRNPTQETKFPKIEKSPRFNTNQSQFHNKSNQNMTKSYYMSENEMKGSSQFKNEQQTDINFYNNPQSQGTEIIIELSKRQQLNKNCKEQLEKFIQNYYGQGNIKIVVNLLDRLGDNQQKQQKEQYQLLKMAFNQTTINEEDKLFQQRIYKFKGQPENNLQSLIQTIIYSVNILPTFQEYISQIGGHIEVNYEGCYLQIPSPQIRQVDVTDLDFFFFDTICHYFENTIILQIECQSNAEAFAKFKIIYDKGGYNIIEKQLGFKFKDIILLKLDMLICQLGKVTDFNLLLKHDQLYCLIEYNGKSIQESQNKLNDVTDSILFYDLPYDEEEIKQKINFLKREYPDIYIEISNCQTLEDSRLKIQITSTTFLLNEQTSTEFLNQAKKIKTQIEGIYLPYKNITISQKQKVIWENYLQEYFQQYQSCFNVHQNGETIEIALKTNQEKWRELEKQLADKLKFYSYQPIKLEAKSQIINQLKNCQNKNKLFKQVFQSLFADFENQINVTINEVDDKNIIFQVIFDKRNFNQLKIEDILKTQFIANLNVKRQNLLYEDSLKYFQLQSPELIQNNNIFVHQAPQHVAYFLGLDEHLEDIKEFFLKLKGQYNNEWIKQELTIENKLIFNLLYSKYCMKDIELKLGTSIEFIKATNSSQNKIIIQGFLNEILNLLKRLSELENRMNTYIKINNLELSQQEIENLIGKQPELSLIEEQTSSYFQFQKIVSFSPEQAIIEKLTFDGKEISIVKGDITQIECESIVYQILNDKCELGDIGLQNQQVKNLLKMTDNHIHEFFKEIMKNRSQLNPGDLFYYKVNTQCHVDHIFNIYPPTYRQAKTLARDQKIIEQLVSNIFKMAKEKKIKQIAFPIISVQIFGFYMSMASQILLKAIIHNLFQEDCDVKQIFILENDDQRCKKIIYHFNQIVSDNPEQKTENYLKQQWQWFEQDHYEDYDDYEVNRKICKMYSLFEKGQDQQFNILYPYSKYPGTHLIDLDQQKIWDKTHNNSEQSIISIDNFGERKYYIDGRLVKDDLNRYLIQQEIQGKRKFDIFYKFYEIHLTSQGHFQKNLQFGNIRAIQFIPYEKPNFEDVLIQQNSQLKIEKMIGTSQLNGSQSIHYDINQQKKVKYDQLLIHTSNDDENIPKQKLLELLQNSTVKKTKTSQTHFKTQQTTQKQSEQMFLIRSPTNNRKLLLPKREPLQDKN